MSSGHRQTDGSLYKAYYKHSASSRVHVQASIQGTERVSTLQGKLFKLACVAVSAHSSATVKKKTPACGTPAAVVCSVKDSKAKSKVSSEAPISPRPVHPALHFNILSASSAPKPVNLWQQSYGSPFCSILGSFFRELQVEHLPNHLGPTADRLDLFQKVA
eukprot:2389312-Amphidinium_carterae.3